MTCYRDQMKYPLNTFHDSRPVDFYKLAADKISDFVVQKFFPIIEDHPRSKFRETAKKDQNFNYEYF